MDDIEAGTIARPEFELVQCDKGVESYLFIGALFRITPETGLEGWFVWQELEVLKENVAFCRVLPKETAGSYKNVLLCGCPERINTSAILNNVEARSILSSFLKEEINSDFRSRPFNVVFAGQEEITA